MSSLNQAFFKAYGREASPPADEAATAQTPAAATPTAQPAPVIANWYQADTWYRAEAAPASAAPPPHAPFTSAYQSPTASDLGRLVPLSAASATATDQDSQFSPRVATPELVIEEEPAEPLPPTASAPIVSRPAQIVHESQATAAPAIIPPIVAPDLQQLFAPVQVTTSWESSLDYLAPVTTVGPVPALAPPPKKEAPAAPAACPQAAVTAVPTVDAPAAPVSQPPAPPVVAPRLDAAVTAPVPKPHATFSSPSEAPVQATAKPLPASAPVTVAPPTSSAPVSSAAETSPLGLLQPAWEVDRFQWPEHCRQLLSTENEYLTDVGTRLATAARDGLNILAITSTRRSEGRTTLALCLARAAADAGVKVALVDADIENPQLVNELGVEAACGWHDVVLGKQPLAEAAIISLEDKFAFFPWTTSSGLKSLNDPRATRVLRDIAKAYSLVILDLGPVPGRETRLFEDGDHCPVDAAILVRDLRWTSALEAQRVAAHLTAAGVASVGIAENFGPRVQQAA